MKIVLYIITVLIFGMSISLVQAAEYEVRMLNRGAKGVMVFEPDLIKADIGDTVRFVPTDKGHNVQSIKGMLPVGVEAFKSPFNEEYVLKLTDEGIYGVKCAPHYPMGMAALVISGIPKNIENALEVKNPPKVKKLFMQLISQISEAN